MTKYADEPDELDYNEDTYSRENLEDDEEDNDDKEEEEDEETAEIIPRYTPVQDICNECEGVMGIDDEGHLVCLNEDCSNYLKQLEEGEE